jgi:anti-sigma regulatory factor (Ser/Thr protein kinase)
MPSQKLTLTLTNSLEALAARIKAAGAYLTEQGVGIQDTNHAELVIEELVTNIIKYGCKDMLEHEIHIELAVFPKHIRIQIIDDAAPFDPTAPLPSDHNADIPLEKRSLGKLGLVLVKKLTHDFQYKRCGVQNKQTLILNRSAT